MIQDNRFSLHTATKMLILYIFLLATVAANPDCSDRGGICQCRGAPCNVGDGGDPTCCQDDGYPTCSDCGCGNADQYCGGDSGNPTCCQDNQRCVDPAAQQCSPSPSPGPSPGKHELDLHFLDHDGNHCHQLQALDNTTSCFTKYWGAHGYQFDMFTTGLCPSQFVTTDENNTICPDNVFAEIRGLNATKKK